MSSSWRLARPEDDDAIVHLCLALYREDPSPQDPREPQIRATLARFRAEPVRGRAVVLGAGAPQGYALLASFWSNEYGGEICTIDEFYVAPARRGQGGGRQLLESLKRGCALWEPTPVALLLETTPGNARARRFYESLGFEQKKNAHLLVKLG